MRRLAWIPNSTDTWLEKEALTVSTVSKGWCTEFSTGHQKLDEHLHKPHIYLSWFTVNRIKELHKVTVRIPPDNEKSNLIRIEGDPQGVQEAKKELLELASRMVSTDFTGNMLQSGSWWAITKHTVSLAGERAYKGPDHWTAFSQSHYWPKRGED